MCKPFALTAILSLVFTSLAIAATDTRSALASERYPAARHYVNQTGQILVVGDATRHYEMATPVLPRITLTLQASSPRIVPHQKMWAKKIAPHSAIEVRGVALQDQFNATRGESARLVGDHH